MKDAYLRVAALDVACLLAAAMMFRSWRKRQARPAMVAMNRLVTTASSPEIEIAWPAIPSVALKSAAIGVSKLTGKNSEAMSIATHRVIDPTALQGFGVATSICWFVAVAFIACCLG